MKPVRCVWMIFSAMLLALNIHASGQTTNFFSHSFPLNPYVRVLDGQWLGTTVASDGNCYFASSTHSPRHGAAFFRYNPRVNEVKMLTDDITRVCGEDPAVQVPQGKIHSPIVEHNGWLYFATHFSDESVAGKNGYSGSHVVGYELTTGQFRDLGIVRSNFTCYAAVGLDAARNQLYVFVTSFATVLPANEGSHLYRVDLTTGAKQDLGIVKFGVEGTCFWFFVDAKGDCWFTIREDNGTLYRANAATGQIDKWPNILPEASLGGRFWIWAQAMSADKCVFKLSTASAAGNFLWTFDAVKFQTNNALGFQSIANVGPFSLGAALTQDRVYYIQRAGRQPQEQGYTDFHLLSVTLSQGTITDYGLLKDEKGHLAWRIPGMTADAQGNLYMVGDWWLFPDEIGTDVGTSRYVSGTTYTNIGRGEFFATANPITNQPTIYCSTNRVVACQNASGTPVTFQVAAFDIRETNVTAICRPASGSLFQIGTTNVTCTATNHYGRSNSCSFSVTVAATQDFSPASLNTSWLGSNRLKISWPLMCAPVQLQEATSLPASSNAWVPVARAVTTQSGLNSITITNPAGQHFYRLKSTRALARYGLALMNSSACRMEAFISSMSRDTSI